MGEILWRFAALFSRFVPFPIVGSCCRTAASDGCQGGNEGKSDAANRSQKQVRTLLGAKGRLKSPGLHKFVVHPFAYTLGLMTNSHKPHLAVRFAVDDLSNFGIIGASGVVVNDGLVLLRRYRVISLAGIVPQSIPQSPFCPFLALSGTWRLPQRPILFP